MVGEKMYEYKAKVLKVKDGDTIVALIDLGFGVFHKVNIRMYGIDAPETRTRDKKEKAAGLRSKKFLNKLIGRKHVYINTIKTKTGKKKKTFTRYLGRVYLDGKIGRGEGLWDISKVMLESGHARKFTEDDLKRKRKSRKK